ncbi:MAG: YegP family protein [Bacteroidales bacterium]|nr:YegP family protein [Bacteroidales bacterium]
MAATKMFQIWSSKKWNFKKLKFVKMWFWHLVSISNLGVEIVAQGETNGYFNLADCKKGIEFVKNSNDAKTEII